tara:strand:+ start:247 stop:924 length:678 start_codon:yes stop_codon:yes gene_type:complete
MQSEQLLKVPKKRGDTSIKDWVYFSLSELLLNGEFTPGMIITLRGIADVFEVSPMPVREAVQRLVSDGALEFTETRRICVAEINKDKFDELFHARVSLEPKIAVSALPAITDKTLRLITEVDKRLMKSINEGNVEEYVKCNRQFHFLIYNCSSSVVLLPIVNSLWLQFSPFMRVVVGRVGTHVMRDYHESVIESIIEKDAEGLQKALYSNIFNRMTIVKNVIFCQ